MAPSHALFDLNGTLFDPSVMAEALPADANGEGFVDAVLGDAVLLGVVETITGSFRDFAELLRTAAARRLRAIEAEGALEAVIQASQLMRPFPGAGEAVERLRVAGIGVGVLTNSSGETARSLLSRTGFELDPVIGTDEVGAFKPDPRVYRRGAERVDVDPGEVVLVTAHWWDAVGAKRAGMQAAWISRREGFRLEVEPAPDYEAGDLAEIARLIASG